MSFRRGVGDDCYEHGDEISESMNWEKLDWTLLQKESAARG
jgi:hypothetical protein